MWYLRLRYCRIVDMKLVVPSLSLFGSLALSTLELNNAAFALEYRIYEGGI